MGSLFKLACVVVVCMAVVAALIAQAQAQVQAQVEAQFPRPVYRYSIPYSSYVVVRVIDDPLSGWCDGVRVMADAARTTGDGRAMCNYLRYAAATFPGLNSTFPSLNSTAADSILSQCGVEDLPFDFSTFPNCDSIN